MFCSWLVFLPFAKNALSFSPRIDWPSSKRSTSVQSSIFPSFFHHFSIIFPSFFHFSKAKAGSKAKAKAASKAASKAKATPARGLVVPKTWAKPNWHEEQKMVLWAGEVWDFGTDDTLIWIDLDILSLILDRLDRSRAFFGRVHCGFRHLSAQEKQYPHISFIYHHNIST